jgi:ribosomal-protein-alanine N-acetyltransferase
MNVREATPADTDAVVTLFQAMDWDRPWPRPQLGPKHLEGKLVLVAEEDGEIVGFAIACRERAGRGHLVTLDVRPGRQRRGIGSELLRAIEEGLAAHGVHTLILETLAGEDGARRFYERHGYAVVRRAAGYYQGGRDAWVMAKRTVPDSTDSKGSPG